MIRVLIVSPNRLVGNVIARVLEDVPNVAVIGSVIGVEEALEAAAACDVALVSTALPGSTALDLTRHLTQTHPTVKVLVLGLTQSEEEIIPYAEAGAAGYVLKDDSIKDLVRGLRAAYRDEALVSPEIASALMSHLAELVQLLPAAPGPRDYVNLTSRELNVLELMAQNLTNSQIAERLTIADGTVKSHVHRILKKLNAHSREDAIRFWPTIRNMMS